MTPLPNGPIAAPNLLPITPYSTAVYGTLIIGQYSLAQLYSENEPYMQVLVIIHTLVSKFTTYSTYSTSLFSYFNTQSFNSYYGDNDKLYIGSTNLLSLIVLFIALYKTLIIFYYLCV